jgi:hypothetical protein
MTIPFKSAIITGIIISIALALTLSTGCISALAQNDADYPTINYNSNAPDYTTIESKFEFQNRDIIIKYHVDKKLYEAAKNTDKLGHVSSDTPYVEYSTEYFKAFIEKNYMGTVYEAILYGLRDIRDRLSLDDDGYAELITAYVQSIPYENNTETTKFPIETVYGNTGDCADKTILLAGLLLNEGYDVALFEYDIHIMPGIKTSSNSGYDNSGYTLIETTTISPIGYYDNDEVQEYTFIDLSGGIGIRYSATPVS